MAEVTMSWTKTRDYQVALIALRDIKGVILAELESNPVPVQELIGQAAGWYLVALEARRIAVIFENERKRRLQNHDYTNQEPNRL